MSVWTQLKNRIRPGLPEPEPGSAEADRKLTDVEFSKLFALLRLLVDDKTLTEPHFRQFLESRIARHPGLLVAFRDGIGLLGESFERQPRAKQERRLSKILRRYPFHENNSAWRKRIRFTSENIDLLVAPASAKRLREYVVRELLRYYYGNQRGWELVNYENYPGKPVLESELGHVVGVERRGGELFLLLEDGSYEKFDQANRSDDGLWIQTKGGAQRSSLTQGVLEGIEQFLATASDEATRASDGPFDCLIVGSGPLGAAAASVLVKAGLNVAMFEAGAPPDEDRFAVMERTPTDGPAWDFDPWDFELHGDDLGLNTFSLRRVGGSSLAWGAVTPRFVANDFRLHSEYGVGTDWPIGYHELEPYYVKSERFIGVASDDDNPFSSPRSAPFPMPAYPWSETDRMVEAAAGKLGITLHSTPNARNTETYDGRSKCLDYGVCRACPIGAMFSSDQTIDRLKEHPNFTLYSRAEVTEVLTDRHRRPSGVRYYDSEGTQRELSAPRVILAAQAIENVRLLLLSEAGGLANRSGTLGKYLTEHVKFYLTGRVDQKLSPYARGYETATTMQFHDHPQRGEFAGARLLIRENAGPTPLEIALGSGLWGAELKDEIRATFGRFITLGAFMEQLPYEQNAVDLSPTVKDRHGRPAARIRFKLMAGSYERRGYAEMTKIIRKIFAQLGAHDVRVEVPPLVSGHYMGTHRMGNDAADSVTDSYLECHDVRGLYLASYGAFPTGGISNPVVTGVALAIRMAEKITREFQTSAKPGAQQPLEHLHV